MNDRDLNFNKVDITKIKGHKIKIIGFGNILMGDDGIGIRVIEEIKKKGIFKNIKNVEIIDGGTSGIDLIFILQQADRAIIIDAVDAGQEIGKIVTFRIDEIKEIFKKNQAFKSFSLHDIDLTEIFELIKTLKIDTEIRIIVINPKKVGYGDKLSSEIESKIPAIISEVKKEVIK